MDRIYEFSFGNKTKRIINPVPILIKPEIQGLLPVYKKEEFNGFETREFHKTKNNEIYSYANHIINAMENN